MGIKKYASKDGRVLKGRSGMYLRSKIQSERGVQKSDVQLCTLCGTLNSRGNAECWTCGWQGSFSRDAQTIDLSWQRLCSEYEEVRWEHVTARRSRKLGDFGAARPASFFGSLLSRIGSYWEQFQTRRDLRSAQRAASLKSRIPSKPDQLGV